MGKRSLLLSGWCPSKKWVLVGIMVNNHNHAMIVIESSGFDYWNKTKRSGYRCVQWFDFMPCRAVNHASSASSRTLLTQLSASMRNEAVPGKVHVCNGLNGFFIKESELSNSRKFKAAQQELFSTLHWTGRVELNNIFEEDRVHKLISAIRYDTERKDLIFQISGGGYQGGQNCITWCSNHLNKIGVNLGRGNVVDRVVGVDPSSVIRPQSFWHTTSGGATIASGVAAAATLTYACGCSIL